MEKILNTSVFEEENIEIQNGINPHNIFAKNTIHLANNSEESCPTCSSKSSKPIQYIYSIGRIQPRFTSIGIEKEFAQATSKKDTASLSDNQTFHDVLNEPNNRYLARKLCWVLTIQGLETYLLQPLHPNDIDFLIESINPNPKLTDVNVIVGIKEPIAPPQYCNGLQIPIVGFDQLYSFDVDSLLKSIPKPEKVAAKVFNPIAEELFMRIIQMTDNAGATDDHRAINYLAVRYHGIYDTAADCYSRNFSLSGVEVKQSSFSNTRKIVDVIFNYNNRNTDVSDKYFCRVDITEEFPFLVTKMQVYIER